MSQHSMDIDTILGMEESALGMEDTIPELKMDAPGNPRRRELFPFEDEDFPPVHDPLVIARPHRFATKREVAELARQGTAKLEKSSSSLLSYVTLRQWADIIKEAMDEIKPRAEEEFQRFYDRPATIRGATVGIRTVASKWKYPAELEDAEKQLSEKQTALKKAKKQAEEDGRAVQVWKKKGLVVTFAP